MSFRCSLDVGSGEGCPILSNRVQWKMRYIDSIDWSNGELLFSIGKVPLSIGLLHLISET